MFALRVYVFKNSKRLPGGTPLFGLYGDMLLGRVRSPLPAPGRVCFFCVYNCTCLCPEQGQALS